MPLSPGTRLGPYEITGQIGSGGMGEVYRATDTNLKRAVAIKVLPDAVAADPERLARFQREAEVLAALNHPHIAAIYGLERADSMTALVLELVEGPTLADRIAQGPIPVDEALSIAKQIADGLEAAHERGIIHRDLKPANVKVRPDGTVKVLDFGLAKALAPASAAVTDVTVSPNITSPAMMTGIGVLLGTAAYMSPEQARGKAVDKRCDIWAFGCVLYEMVTGKQAFRGEDITETLASVVKAEPDWDVLPADTPSNIRTLLFRCLQKDIKKRVRDAGDIVIECEQLVTTSATVVVTPLAVVPIFSRRSVAIGLVGLLLGGFIAGFAVWRLTPEPMAPVSRFTVMLPLGQRLAVGHTAIAVSPDGRRLAYVAIASGGLQQLYLREMDSLEGKPLAGTEGAVGPFFSPDGLRLGFFTFNRLKNVSVSGGPPVILAPVRDFGRGGSWGPDGNIVFASGPESGLSLVSAAGGTVESLTTIDRQKGEGSHRFPHYLPGGRALLLTVGTGGSWDDARIEVLPLGSDERKVLIGGGSDARYVPTGHLVHRRTGSLVAVPFDLGRMEVVGSPVVLVEGVLPATNNTGAAQATFTYAGSLLYVPGAGGVFEITPVWVDRAGREQPFPLPPPPRVYGEPRFSPNGQSVALDIDEGNGGDVWIYELPRGTLTRLTVDGARLPIWTSDGKKVTFASGRSPAAGGLFWKPADGSGNVERLTTSENPQRPDSWSPNGETLAFTENDSSTGLDIWALPLKNGKKSRPLIRTSFNETNLAFSPDGGWIAYQSDESGRYEVYVQPFPGPGGRVPISTQGGTGPAWSRDGRELFYRSGDKMMAVATTIQPTFQVAKPTVLFEKPYYYVDPLRDYDIASDGRRFLMLKEGEQVANAIRMNLVLNWFEELKRLVPTK
jgi:Tol biopolymer transport system component